jgi:hypothetical protein
MKRPIKRTRRLVPHLHKPRRHGTPNNVTWVSSARVTPPGSMRRGRAPSER